MESNIVNVRWHDGYLETFEVTEVRFGCDLLWMRLSDGGNRHIPLRSVRWWDMSKESHGTNTVCKHLLTDQSIKIRDNEIMESIITCQDCGKVFNGGKVSVGASGKVIKNVNVTAPFNAAVTSDLKEPIEGGCNE